MRKYLSLMLIVSISAHIGAYNLKQLSNKDNLSNSSITTIYQDSKGKMWFGTCEGLNSYDGNQVTNYQFATGENAIFGNLIDQMLETEPGVLWVQTYHGLNKVDRKNNRTEHFNEFKKKLFIDKDKDNRLFVIQDNNSIYYYGKEDKTFRKLHVPGLRFNDILRMHISPQNRMWIFTTNGRCYSYAIQTEKSSDEIVLISDKSFVHRLPIVNCFVKENQAYFADREYNLYKRNLSGENTTLICNFRKEAAGRGQICSIVNHHEDVFVGFEAGGVLLLKKVAGKPLNYVPEYLPINCGIFCMQEDRNQDVVWIGTDGQGVYMYSNDSFSIKSTLLRDLLPGMAKPVRAIFLDKQNALWIGCKGGGLLRIRDYSANRVPAFGQAEVLNTHNSQLNSDVVYCFGKSSRNLIWIGNEGGLNYYSFRDRKIRKIALAENNLPIRYIHDVFEQDSVLWIASVGMGVIKARIGGTPDAPVLTGVRSFTINNQDFASNYFFTMYPENDSILWFGNRGYGLLRLNTRTSGSKLVQFKNVNPTLNELYCISRDGKGNLLFGTGFGLVKYRSGDNYRIFNKSDGFPSNIIHGITRDTGDKYWLSTNRGMVYFNSRENTFKIYDYAAGLNVVEFSDGAFYKDERSGTTFFGGINGFISITKTDTRTSKYTPPIHFDRLSILGKEYSIDEFLSGKKGQEILKLNYRQNFFSLSCIAIDFINGGNYSYLYKLGKVNEQWIDNGKSNTISFSNIPPGTYKLLVKYCNRATGKESPTFALTLKITPPWYLSLFARIVYALLVLYLLYLLYEFLKAQERRKREDLLKKVDERHKEEVYESKLSFFTNIAHEFCTPLTLIDGPCNQMLAYESSDPFILRCARIIQRNAQRLNDLILELIEFRRIETGNRKPQVCAVQVSSLMAEIVDSFKSTSEQDKISFQVEMAPDLVWNTDKGFFTTIVSNLISNAFKYTYKNGMGAVSVRLSGKDDQLSIQIANKGGRIHDEDIDRIFDRYTILDNFENQSGLTRFSRNGLGLAISNNLAQLLKGDIAIDNSLEGWITFQVNLPALETNTEEYVEDPKLGIRTRNNSEEAEILQKYEFNNQKSTIMIVEDEAEMLQFMNDLFAEEYNVIPLNNPRMAEEILRDMHPSIIITDVMMPGVDGISLTRKIKSNPETSHLPILVLSAKHEMDKQIEALDAGAEMYITKPFNIDFLKVTVRQVLGRKETLRNYFNSPFSAFDLNVGKLTHIDDKKFMKNILSIINENLTNEELSVQFIAKELNICSRQLYRKLEQIGEDSPTNIIRECRLNKAKDLLLTSKMTIDEIVFKSGFSNKVTFFKTFNKKFNCTPKEFRNSHLKEIIQ